MEGTSPAFQSLWNPCGEATQVIGIDLCPKLWEILSTLFFLQITHGKGHLANLICRGLWLLAQLSFGTQRDVIRPLLNWERERRSTFVYLLPSPGCSPICKWTAIQIAWGLDQALQPLTSPFPHTLSSETTVSSPFPWLHSILSSAIWRPHYLACCSTKKKKKNSVPQPKNNFLHIMKKFWCHPQVHLRQFCCCPWDVILAWVTQIRDKVLINGGGN